MNLYNNKIISDLSSSTDFHQIDYNFRPIKIKIYKNGDVFDGGLNLIVTRWQFKHWITFLDYLSRRIQMNSPIHRIFRHDGFEINHLDELENGDRYVAVARGSFVNCRYGGAVAQRIVVAEKSWKFDRKIATNDANGIESVESTELYMRHQGYPTCTRLPFPFDNRNSEKIDILSKSMSKYNKISIKNHNRKFIKTPCSSLIAVNNVHAMETNLGSKSNFLSPLKKYHAHIIRTTENGKTLFPSISRIPVISQRIDDKSTPTTTISKYQLINPHYQNKVINKYSTKSTFDADLSDQIFNANH